MADYRKYCYSCSNADFFGYCEVKGEKVLLTKEACKDYRKTNAKTPSEKGADHER